MITVPRNNEVLPDAEMTYLELTAKHAPAELGTEENARKVLTLMSMYANCQKSAEEVEALEEQVADLQDQVSDFENKVSELDGQIEDLQEKIETLEAEAA